MSPAHTVFAAGFVGLSTMSLTRSPSSVTTLKCWGDADFATVIMHGAGLATNRANVDLGATSNRLSPHNVATKGCTTLDAQRCRASAVPSGSGWRM